MKTINNYINEKLKISKNKRTEYTLFPKDKKELQQMIETEICKNGVNCSLNHIDVSKIKQMDALFFYRPLRKFNGDISKWDVSNVTDAYRMFASSNYTGEYGDISDWDVSKITDMTSMFETSNYNGDISDWDVSNVKSMHTMFMCSLFDGDLSRWDVSNVFDMGGLFYEEKYTGKNASIGNRDISKVETMESMFKDSEFNSDISSWTIDGNFCDYHFMLADCKKLEKRYYPTINR